jgi:hypothetical protein
MTIGSLRVVDIRFPTAPTRICTRTCEMLENNATVKLQRKVSTARLARAIETSRWLAVEACQSSVKGKCLSYCGYPDPKGAEQD